MTQEIKTQLDKIAALAFVALENRENLETTNSGADFVEVSTFAIREALKQAYELGREDGAEEVRWAFEI